MQAQPDFLEILNLLKKFSGRILYIPVFLPAGKLLQLSICANAFDTAYSRKKSDSALQHYVGVYTMHLGTSQADSRTTYI